MDIGYIPAPPPEEFEEVPLPPPPSSSASDWDNNGTGYVQAASSASVPDNGAAWQRAMDALNQSQAPKSGAFAPPYGNPYGAAPAIMPAQNWPQPSYGYAPSYQQPYSAPPASMYAGTQFNHGQGLGYGNPRQSTPTHHQYSQPVQQQQQQYPSPSLPNSQSQPLLSQNAVPQYGAPSQQQSPTAYSPHASNQNNNFGRTRMVRPRYSPYAYPSSTTGTLQPAYGQTAPPTYQSPYQSAPPPDSAASAFSSSSAVTAGVGGSNSMQLDMEIDASPSVGYSHNYAQKQAPGTGGIRFQLSKKNAEVKVSNPLLQRRPPLLHSPRASTAAAATSSTTNGAAVNQKSLVAPATAQPALDFLTNVQSNDWPASLQDYVTKAIRITPTEKHERVMLTITQMITTAYKTNTLFTAKWETAPMPYANESANELFGLSPKRENESPPPSRHSFFSSSTSSFRARYTGPASGRGSGRGAGRGAGGRNADNVRRGRVSGRRSSESEDDNQDRHYQAKFSGSKAASSRWDSEGKNTSPEVDYLPLHPKGGATGSTGKKGKSALGHASPKGKLMGFGVEQPKSAEDVEKLRKRQERFSAGGGGNSASPGTGVKPLNKPKKAASRSPARAANGQAGPRRALSAIRTVVGTCQTVEKEYFRLTEAVDASQVRPVSVLSEALALVKEKWKKEHNYRYAESQLKSIRQDLRVQHLFSPFTVEVYETHARIALEVGDQAEFTQCLSQLEWLYDTLTAVHRGGGAWQHQPGGGGGDGGGIAAGCQNRREFLSYRILYVMRQNRTTDVTRVRTQLSDEDKADTCIVFAFSVLSAYFAGDYQQFFSLYKIAPLMAGYVMEVSIPQFRQRIFVNICTAYRPNLPVAALKEILRFPNDAELREFLRAYKLTYTWLNGPEEIDCKASLPVVKAGPEAVDSATPAKKAQPVSATRTASKTRRKIKA